MLKRSTKDRYGTSENSFASRSMVQKRSVGVKVWKAKIQSHENLIFQLSHSRLLKSSAQMLVQKAERRKEKRGNHEKFVFLISSFRSVKNMRKKGQCRKLNCGKEKDKVLEKLCFLISTICMWKGVCAEESPESGRRRIEKSMS